MVGTTDPTPRKETKPLTRWQLSDAQREARRLTALWKREVAEHDARGEKQHPTDPSNPWSELIWSPCDLTCTHTRQTP